LGKTSERERRRNERENFQVERERGAVQEMLQEYSSGRYPAKRYLGAPWCTYLSKSVNEHLFELTTGREILYCIASLWSKRLHG